MNEIEEKFLNIWLSIKEYFRIEDLDYSKLNKQLEIFNCWVANKGIGLIEAATGFGKTMIAIIAIKRMNLKDSLRKTIVVVPNINLKEDWTDPKVGHITVFNLKNVEVFVINSFTMLDETHYCDLLILDECHRYAKEESEYFSTALEICKYSYVMCLSATLSSKERDFIYSYNISRVGYISLDEAEKRNWISKYTIYNISVPLTQEDIEKKLELDELHSNYYKKFGYDFELAMCCKAGANKKVKHKTLGLYKTGKEWRLFQSTKMGWDQSKGEDHLWSPKNISKYANMWFYYMGARKKFLHESSNKLDLAEKIINHLGMKTILFSEYSKVADELENRLGDLSRSYHSNISTKIYNNNKIIGEGVEGRKYKIYSSNEILTFKEIKTIYPNSEIVSKDKLKQRIKEEFKDNKFKYLLTVKALDEGFDCDDIEVGVIHSGSSVKRNNVQRMGRVLRSKEGKNAIIINIYVADSQDEKWVNTRQIGTPKSKINWINDVEDIIKNVENEQLVLTK